MIVTYLERILDDLQTEKINLEVEWKSLNRMMNQNLAVLEELNKKNQDPFQANSRESQYQSKHMHEILDLHEDDINKLEEYSNRIQFLNNEIEELKSVIKIAKNNQIQLQEKDESLSNLYKFKILEAQEKERQRIARELHDLTVQDLTGIIYKSEFASQLMGIDIERSKLELSTISKLLKDVIRDTRNMIFNLRPMTFDDIGFESSIENVLSKIDNYSDISVDFKIEGDSYELNSTVAITILRVIQEAYMNALKHAECSEFKVVLKYFSDKVIIHMEDNGRGFDMENSGNKVNERSIGYGLSTMQERVDLLSGVFDISSNIGKGTSIDIKIPINKEELKDGS